MTSSQMSSQGIIEREQEKRLLPSSSPYEDQDVEALTVEETQSDGRVPFAGRQRTWGTSRRFAEYSVFRLFPSRTSLRIAPQRLVTIAIFFIVILLFVLPFFAISPSGKWSTANDAKFINEWTKPEGLKVIAIIFFGRRPTLEVLDCYLRRNLVSNGGYLDEVRFMVHNDNREDLDWLEVVLAEAPEYTRIAAENLGYSEMWQHHSDDRDAMLIKIDDDVVWWNDATIPALVHSLIDHPEAFAMMPHLVNAAAIDWMSYRVGAIHSYLPEHKPPQNYSEESWGVAAWRASQLPTWESTSEEVAQKIDRIKEGKEALGAEGPIPVGEPGGVPYKNARFLPTRRNDTDLHLTPASDSKYDPWGPDWTRWTIAAQKHYSLFENIEKDQLHEYKYGNDEGLWNLNFDRGNINMMAVWNNDILDNEMDRDDEDTLTVAIPRKLHRPVFLQTKGQASHFAFGPQPELRDMDILNRYRAYANEKICAPDKQIPHSHFDTYEQPISR